MALCDSQLHRPLDVLQLRVALGHRVRIPVKSQSRNRVIDVEIEGDVASGRTCEVDDAIVESLEGIVLNDRVTTFHADWEARRLPSGWRIWSSDRRSSEEGVQSCGG